MQASAGRFDKPLMDVAVADVACEHETECGSVASWSGTTDLIHAASSCPCLSVNGGSTRKASLFPEMRVEAMGDRV